MNIFFLLSTVIPESQMLIDTATKFELRPTTMLASDIVLNITGPHQPEILDLLKNFDAVITRVNSTTSGAHDSQVRDTLLKLDPDLQKKMLNGKTYASYPTFSKIVQLHILHKAGIPVPNSYYGDNYQNVDFPVVVKALFGSNGQQVHYVTNREEWDAVMTLYKDGEYLVQEPLPIGQDYRVIVLGGKGIAAHKKISTTGFVTNVTSGGRVEQVEPELRDEIIDIAIHATNAFECEYAGVDVMYDQQKKPRVLEVNRAAGFNQAQEDIWGIHLADEIIKYVKETRA